MTISNAIRTAGPFVGNGITKDFPFSYKVYQPDDLLVAVTDADSVETIKQLDADYSVTLNADQNSNPGGVIRMIVAPAAGTTLAATSNIPIVQTLDLTNNGGFYPQAINNALDRMAIAVQQVDVKVGGALAVGQAASVAKVVNFIDVLADDDGANNISTIQGDTGSRKRNLLAKSREYVTISDFDGADSTGLTSSTAAIRRALASSAGDIVFKRGDWLIGSDVILQSSKRLIAENGAVIRRNSTARITANQPSLIPLSAAADLYEGIDRLTLSVNSYAAVSVGDYLYLKDRTSTNSDYILDFINASTSDLNDPSKWIYQVQVFKVLAKLGNNRVLLDAGAAAPFPLTTTGSIYKVGPGVVENVTIEGFRLVNGPGLASAGAEDAFINTSFLFGLNLRHNQFDLNGLTGGFYGTIGRANIIDNEFNQAARLGVFLRQAMPNSKVALNTFKSQVSNDASVFVEAHNFNIAIASNTFDGSRALALTDVPQLISAVQMDAKVRGVTITGNTVNGYGVGFRLEIGCIGNTITGNTLRNLGIAGMRLNQSGHNTITGNTLHNCGISPTPGFLGDSLGAFTLFDSIGNTIARNTITNSAGNVRPAFLINGERNKIESNELTNAGATIITGLGNRFVGNWGTTMCSSQVVMVNGNTTHYTDIRNNDLVNGMPCVFGIRINGGSECNVVADNRMSGVDIVVGAVDTTNAQSFYNNTRHSTENNNISNIYNVEISAPAMPANATLPRRFRIHSTSTSAVSGALSPNGDKIWEFIQFVPNVGNRFAQLSYDVGSYDV